MKANYGNFNISGVDYKTIGIVAGGIFLLYLMFKNDMKKGAIGALQSINPVNPDNLVNKGVEGVYKGFTGSDEAPGADLYSYTHNKDGSPVGGVGGLVWLLDKAIL